MADAAPAGAQSILQGPIPMMVAVFGIFYFLVLRPQSKKAKDHQKMLSELRKGDEVVTQGGIIGKVSGITDAEITLQVQEGVRFRVTRASVTGKYVPAAEKPKTDAKAS